MNQTQLDGVTKARLHANIALASSGAVLYADDAAYVAHVCASAGLDTLPDSAADSYAAQYAGKSIAALELELVAAVQVASDQYGSNGQPDTPVVTVAGVPAKVTMRQARRALLGAGMLGAVNAAIAAMPGIQGEAARIDWEFSSDVLRNQPLVLTLGPTLGLTGAQLDGLFIVAAKL